MLVFYPQRLVFLAVPKTGTTAYAAALAPHASMVITGPPTLKHAPLYRYNRFFRPMFDKIGGDSLELLAVIREPIDWLRSWYRYRQRSAVRGTPNSTEHLSFEQFCGAYLEEERPAFADVGAQAKFLEPRPNGVCVNTLYRYENQVALQDFLRSRLGVDVSIPVHNPPCQECPALSPSMQTKLKRHLAEDYALWHRAL
ncbi:gamma-glutamyl kinase [Cognatishimia sp. F0-27]|uniref:gamma-glutamyl kinase n=1 Tax=Cognatishimia sp. F0-27 TaxID=2816855 RepID=UPI001D0C9C95|nr:gamma-glutamyl kinase [Cognatishimia sp. F0-27]MCC1491823.1 gamma-glutamyl kinase [Cognatishimia sp. F0-27]